MNWEMVGAIAAIIALAYYIFIDWPRFRQRLTESRPTIVTTLSRTGVAIAILALIGGLFVDRIPKPYYDLVVMFSGLLLILGSACLALSNFFESTGWKKIGAAFLALVFLLYFFFLLWLFIRA